MSLEQIESQLDEFFAKIASGDTNAMRQAEMQSEQWKQQAFAMYMYCLARYTANPQKPDANRNRAATLLQGNLTAKNPEEDKFKRDRWLKDMPLQAKDQIRPLLMQTMGHNENQARAAAARAVARIALIEIPEGQFLDLVPALIKNVLDTQNSPPQIRESSLDCLGMITEEIERECVATHADMIISAVISGMRKEEQNVMIKRKACKAMSSALYFCKRNIEKSDERKHIMDAVLNCCQVNDEEIPISAYQILNEIAELHYDKLKDHMQDIFRLTLEHISNAPEPVARQAIEFWCTLCEEELALEDELRFAKANDLPVPAQLPVYYVKGAVQFLSQTLFQAMTKKDSPDIDPEEFTLSLSAGVCLSLVAQNVEDEILKYAVPFVEQHFMSTDWKFRGAAVSVFGTILDGPTNLDKFIKQVVRTLMERHLQDEVDSVRDAAVWTLSRVVKMHHKCVLDQAEDILKAFAASLEGTPRVAASACWGIHNMAYSFEREDHNPFKQYFRHTVYALLHAADREDFDEFHLRVAAFESLNVVLASAPPGTGPIFAPISEDLVKKLEVSFSMKIVSKDDLMDQNDLQSLLCGVIQVIYNKIGGDMNIFSDRVMQCLLRLLADQRSGDVHEDAFLAVSAVCNAAGPHFEKYMNDFAPLLYAGLDNIAAYKVCSVAVGVVGDVARAIEYKLKPYCEPLVTHLLQNLQNIALDRSVKPAILSCFGDLAHAIQADFKEYFEVVMSILRQAAETVMKRGPLDTDDWDLIDYVNELEEGILEAYTGILQGLNHSRNASIFEPHTNHIMQLISHVASNSRRSEGCATTALGLIIDVVFSLGPKVKSQVNQPFVIDLIKDVRGDFSNNPDTVEIAEQAMNAIHTI